MATTHYVKVMRLGGSMSHHWGMMFLLAGVVAVSALGGVWVDPIGYSEYNPVLLNKADWLRVDQPLPDNLKKQNKKPKGMEIVKAVYGTHDDRRFKDVTQIIKDKVRADNGFLKLTVSNSLFTDPAHGHGKRLKVVYKLGDEELVEEVREGGFIQLPRVKADYFKVDRPKFLMHPRLLRRGFELKEIPSKAYLYAASLGIYQVRLNGKVAGGINSAQEKLSYSNSVDVQCFDVSSLLVKGPNAIGVVLSNGQYCGPLKGDPSKICVFGFEPHFRAQLEMQFVDGSTAVVATDHLWQGTYQFPQDYAEVIDDKKCETPAVISGWDMPGFKFNEKWDRALLNRAVDCEVVKPVQ